MKKFILLFLMLCVSNSKSQISITLYYKKAACGGIQSPDTSRCFLLINKKFIVQYPSEKIDTLYTNSEGKLQLPKKKGKYFLYEPWKYYHQTPAYYDSSFFDKKCLEKIYHEPELVIHMVTFKKIKIYPSYYTEICPQNLPCFKKDINIPKPPKSRP